MRKKKEEALATRQLILDMALKTFGHKGYIATSLEDIALAAGVTRGAIYWHFESKEDLFNTLMREKWLQVNDIFDPCFVQHSSSLETLRCMMTRYMEYLEEDSAYRNFLEFNMFKTDMVPELMEGFHEKQRSLNAFVKMIEQLLCAAVTEGTVRSDIHPHVVAITISGLINGVVLLWLHDTTAFSIKTDAKEIVHAFLNGIVAT